MCLTQFRGSICESQKFFVKIGEILLLIGEKNMKNGIGIGITLTHSLTHLGKVEFELLAVELGLVQLDASTRRRLRGAEVDPHSPETLEHLESRLLVVDPEQGLEPLLQRVEKVRRDAQKARPNKQAVSGDI